MKYLDTNLIKHMWTLYFGNYKTLMKEIKEQLNEDIYHVHGLENSTKLRCQYPPLSLIHI